MQCIINSHIANIIDGPTLLFKGSNGIPTFGVTVEAIHKEKGYRDTWALNDYTLKQPMSQYALGLSNIQYKELLLKIDKLHQDYTIDQITK